MPDITEHLNAFNRHVGVDAQNTRPESPNTTDIDGHRRTLVLLFRARQDMCSAVLPSSAVHERAVGPHTRMYALNVERLEIGDVKKITSARFGDSRGYFSEVFKDAWFREKVADVSFVQDNESLSAQTGTVRGLHFQLSPFAQGKLVRCLRGALLDVAVDIRHGSPTYGKWVSAELSPENGAQLWVPAGFAHGFMTLQPDTIISYKVTAPYSAEHDRGLRWDDPAIGISWPRMDGYVLSDKDKKQPLLSELPSYFQFS